MSSPETPKVPVIHAIELDKHHDHGRGARVLQVRWGEGGHAHTTIALSHYRDDLGVWRLRIETAADTETLWTVEHTVRATK